MANTVNISSALDGTAVNVSQDTTAIVNILTGPLGPKGDTGDEGPRRERKHDYVDPYSYCGVALEGSLTSANVWTITRITISSDGTVTTATATNVAWDNRYTVPYT
jgi:hypothetical protein